LDVKGRGGKKEQEEKGTFPVTGGKRGREVDSGDEARPHFVNRKERGGPVQLGDYFSREEPDLERKKGLRKVTY